MQLTDNKFLTGKGFGVHSPWAYHLIEYVINEKLPYYAYDDLYKFWQKAPDYLPQYPQSRDELVFRLVNCFNPHFIVEIGTGAGVTTGYLASVSKQSRVITIDCRHSANKAVAHNLKKIRNIEYRTGNQLELLNELIQTRTDSQTRDQFQAQDVLQAQCQSTYPAQTQSKAEERPQATAPDFVHIAHTPYFRESVEMLLPVMKRDGIIVIQDLGKKEKKEWWKGLIEDPRIGVTFQLSKIGILFFDHSKTKQHYLLR